MLRRTLCHMTVLAFVAACSPDKSSSTFEGDDANARHDQSHQPLYRSLLQSLRLTDDPAMPSQLIENDDYREKLRASLVDDAHRSTCGQMDVRESIRASQGGTRSLLAYAREGSAEERYAVVSVPSKSEARHPIFYYTNSRHEVPYVGEERKQIFGEVTGVFVTPVFGGQAFAFNGTRYEASGASTVPIIGDVDDLYTAALCIQNQADKLVLADGTVLSEHLLASHQAFQGYRSVLVGTATGALTATIAASRSGALLLSSDTDVAHFAHFDAAILLNPFYSFYSAESRLLLAAMVRGNTEETHYARINGVKEMRAAYFREYRRGKLSSDELAFEIARRDGYLLAPFLHLALKDFTLAPGDKGPETGALFVAHGVEQRAYPVNASRIFANVFSSISFKVADTTSGVRFLYREYPDEVSGLTDYTSPFSAAQLMSPGKELSDVYVRPPQFLNGRQNEYRWVIRGRAFKGVNDNRFVETIKSFLDE